MQLFWDKLSATHDKTGFESGVKELDEYLKTQANQDVKRNLSSVFVLADKNGRIVGYYAISQYSLTVEEFPEQASKKLPLKRRVACTLLGRLAVDKRYQGQGYGEELLFHALNKALVISKEIASFAIIVDAKDEKAKRFYQKYDFISLKDMPFRLYIPMKGLEQKLNLSSVQATQN
ncbi:MAG: GNAT family N-acetyltransferase [Synergistaceae bacterium]|nr:GNAT family N-acetyltransferase [Synergistaceae bacterium]